MLTFFVEFEQTSSILEVERCVVWGEGGKGVGLSLGVCVSPGIYIFLLALCKLDHLFPLTGTPNSISMHTPTR